MHIIAIPVGITILSYTQHKPLFEKFSKTKTFVDVFRNAIFCV